MIKHLEKGENFEELTKTRCLVDFYAEWCGPCKMISPILEEIASKKNITIIKVNTDEHNDLATKMGIMSIPTLILMENSKEVSKHIGFMSKEDILDFIK